MAKNFAIYREPERPPRPFRRWLWGAADVLRNGSVAAAFLLALRSGLTGALALAALICGLVLNHVLEATSQGD